MTAPGLASAPSTAAAMSRGARWLTLATLAIGAVNYAYALVLTRLLDPADYATFAAGQALLLTAGTIAVASVPWVLAAELTRAGGDGEQRRRAVWFAAVTGSGQGVVAGVVVALLALSFSSGHTAVVLGVSTSAVFLSAIVAGWLQGSERFATIAGLRLVEVVVKAGTGTLLVAAGGAVTAALAGFGAGAGVVVVAGGWLLRADLRPRPGVLSSRRLWRSALGVAGIQGLVSVLASLDVVLVAVLPTPPRDAASYQAGMILARVPLFLAGAVAAVAFPLLIGGRSPVAALLAGSSRLYLTVAVPLGIAVATLPSALVHVVFPPTYDAVGRLLPVTACAGVLIGFVELLTTFFQAAGSYRSCLQAQLLGLAVAAVALPTGWQLHGVLGLACGALLGAAVTTGLLLRAARRVWAGAPVPRAAPVARWLGLAAVLGLLRPLPVAWALVAGAVLVGCAARAFRPDPDRGAPG